MIEIGKKYRLKKLKGWLSENDLTIKETAERCNLNYNTVQKVVNTGKCNLETAKKIIIGTNMPLQTANDIFFDNIVAKQQHNKFTISSES